MQSEDIGAGGAAAPNVSYWRDLAVRPGRERELVEPAGREAGEQGPP